MRAFSCRYSYAFAALDCSGDRHAVVAAVGSVVVVIDVVADGSAIVADSDADDWCKSLSYDHMIDFDCYCCCYYYCCYLAWRSQIPTPLTSCSNWSKTWSSWFEWQNHCLCCYCCCCCCCYCWVHTIDYYNHICGATDCYCNSVVAYAAHIGNYDFVDDDIADYDAVDVAVGTVDRSDCTIAVDVLDVAAVVGDDTSAMAAKFVFVVVAWTHCW